MRCAVLCCALDGSDVVEAHSKDEDHTYAALKSSGLSPFTNLVLMPSRGSATLSWLYVPPYLRLSTSDSSGSQTQTYRFDVEMMLSPACASVRIAMNCAACPELAASAATPPSSAAILFSKTSTVGCMT